jgi:competence protein ComEC
LWPESGPEGRAAAPKNDDSLVIRLQYGDKTILLPGDAERQTEHEILSENREDALRSDVLKIGHHGGKNSTTEEFLAAVRPQIGIISVGEANPYGHPSPELLKRLEAADVRILRTDREGAVHVLTDGRKIEIRCFVTCAGAENTSSASVEIPNHKQSNEKK